MEWLVLVAELFFFFEISKAGAPHLSVLFFFFYITLEPGLVTKAPFKSTEVKHKLLFPRGTANLT